MRRLPFESAVVRSSKLGCASDPSGALSTSATLSPSGASATARLAPIIPPPAMTTSARMSAVHGAFDVVGLDRQRSRQHFGRAARHRDVVFDAHADVPPLA